MARLPSSAARMVLRVSAEQHEVVEWHEVVEQSGVFDLRDVVRLAPDPEDVVVRDLCGGGHDSGTGCAGRGEGTGHFESIFPSGSSASASDRRTAGQASSSRPRAVRR